MDNASAFPSPRYEMLSSKAELAMFKRLWRHTFGPQPKQLTFADQPACPF